MNLADQINALGIGPNSHLGYRGQLEAKKLSERCSCFIRGAQCNNYRMQESRYCALHGKGKAA